MTDFGDIWVTTIHSDDGTSIEITEAPDTAMFSLDLLFQMEPKFASIEGDVICLHAINGDFRYRVISWERTNLAAPGWLGAVRVP